MIAVRQASLVRLTTRAACLCAALWLFAAPAHAAQYLINPGDDWAAKAVKCRPGDEIVLMPGRHRPASIDRLVGTAEAPIVIRGASTTKPSIIAAQLDGIRIKEASHIVIKDLQIIGGSASGIWIAAAQDEQPADAAAAPQPAMSEPLTAVQPRGNRARDILISNVSISKVGPRGQRHGVYLCGFADARLNNLRIEGWGGSAIELIACEDVVINRPALRGVKDHSQFCGIRARAGCDRVTISEGVFENAGEIAICIGGKSDPEEFIPPIPADAPNASVTEAARVSIEQTRIIGSPCPIAFIHATDSLVRSSTIVRPTRNVFALLNQSPDVRMAVSTRNIFGNNLVMWEPGDVKRLVEVDEGVSPAALVLEPNVWWSGETEEQRRKLGPMPGSAAQQQEQIVNVNPRPDDKLRPTEESVQTFGAGG